MKAAFDSWRNPLLDDFLRRYGFGRLYFRHSSGRRGASA
jgi:hypothetical protein